MSLSGQCSYEIPGDSVLCTLWVLNFSYNGVHGRTQEATNHFLVGTSDYNLSRRGISNLLASSYIYDTAQTYAFKLAAPEIDWFVSEIDGIEIYSEPIPSHIESEESYETLNIDNDEYSSYSEGNS